MILGSIFSRLRETGFQILLLLLLPPGVREGTRGGRTKRLEIEPRMIAIAGHRSNLGCVGKIETLQIFPIPPRPSQMIENVYDFVFS